ncbi:MAG: hypothetical protein ACO23B_11930, partial [Burkholderiaceae bacterium]
MVKQIIGIIALTVSFVCAHALAADPAPAAKDAHGAAAKDAHGAAPKDAHGADAKDAHAAPAKDAHGAA